MRPSFNVAGPSLPGEHYMLPPARRLGRVLRLIDERKYFTLHAGRQTGKTTSARWLVSHCNGAGMRAVWVDLEMAREQPDPARAFRTVLGTLDRRFELTFPTVARPSPEEIDAWLADPASAVFNYLRAVTLADPRPLVVLFDEADGLVGAALVSFLTQLRQGYIERTEAGFPSSVVLIGTRQVRDYALSADERRAVTWLGTTSPFNVTAEAATLGPFTEDEVDELLAQHTAATGQRFEPDAVARIADLTRGHPWLVNAIADQIVGTDLPDRSIAIRVEHVEAAKETIIRERRSHIDSLIARLREPRVRRIIEPMLQGAQPQGESSLDDDLLYAIGLGLVTTQGGAVDIANPIYREVIPRTLTWATQMTIPADPARYVTGGRLDVPRLMRGWQEFWREDGHLAAEGFGYREAGPHLMLMAYLQRVVNGGGRIRREYGIGRGALDLLIEFQGERHVIEVKVRRSERTEEQGIGQIARYLDGLGLSEGWLVIFDPRGDVPWESKIGLHEVERDGKRVFLVGC